VPVRCSARWEIDAVAANKPLSRPERDLGRELRAAYDSSELPHQRVTGHARRAKMRLVSLDVVHDPVPQARLDTVRPIVQRQDQWKY
jgi:hypothetical protein